MRMASYFCSMRNGDCIALHFYHLIQRANLRERALLQMEPQYNPLIQSVPWVEMSMSQSLIIRIMAISIVSEVTVNCSRSLRPV